MRLIVICADMKPAQQCHIEQDMWRPEETQCLKFDTFLRFARSTAKHQKETTMWQT